MNHEVIIVGMGLSALCTAARLVELGINDIGIFGKGRGGSPVIAAINFVLPNNPYDDTEKMYEEDMLKAGYDIANKSLVRDMTQNSLKAFEFLLRWGVEFSKNKDGEYKLRHVSGHTYPRSLCSTEHLIGIDMVKKIENQLKEKGVKFYSGYECVKVLSDKKQVFGITAKDKEEVKNIYSKNVVAAWGGVGNLFGTSTYPKDIKGNTLEIAKDAGATLVDIEFLEYEPMVVANPKGAIGEPCPTAMLGEGAYILNNKKERFILKIRPQGEAGSPKTLLNKEIWKEVQKGNGTVHNGVYVDLRHIDENILKSYPWFYNRLIANGIDPKKELIEVAPMAHSFSGGIKVDNNYESNINGFYAVGEACGGIHGACRCAGNAGSQAVISGFLCGEAISKRRNTKIEEREFEVNYNINKDIFDKYVPQLRKIAEKALGIYREGKELEEAYRKINEILKREDILLDTQTYQIGKSILYMLQAAIRRKESRGTHMRIDYPEQRKEYEKEFIV